MVAIGTILIAVLLLVSLEVFMREVTRYNIQVEVPHPHVIVYTAMIFTWGVLVGTVFASVQ